MNETKVVLEGITVGGKTLREHLEVINHRDAISYGEEIVQKKESFSEWQIKSSFSFAIKNVVIYSNNLKNVESMHLLSLVTCIHRYGI
jgi:Fic family protein